MAYHLYSGLTLLALAWALVLVLVGLYQSRPGRAAVAQRRVEVLAHRVVRVSIAALLFGCVALLAAP